MSSLTFVTACAPYHSDLLPLAIESVKRQTVTCEHVIIYDTMGQGAGWARNQGLRQVKTDFVAFLDADDEVDKDFAAHTLAAFDGFKFVYTDFIDRGETVNAPDTGYFVDGNNQVITALIPTPWVREIGGFDENIPGAEDTKLFLNLQAAKRCGKRLAEPLFYYGAAGKRGAEFMKNPLKDSVMNGMADLRTKAMENCCGENPDLPEPVAQPGDVLAMALWFGNRAVQGKVTGRWYPRTGNRKVESVHPDDVAASPTLWARVQAPPPPVPFVPRQVQQQPQQAPTAFRKGEMLHNVDQAASALFGIPTNRVMTADELRAIQPAPVQPDVSRVQALIAKAHADFTQRADSDLLQGKHDFAPVTKPPPKNKGGRPRKGQNK